MIVSAREWQQARDELLKAEKEATRALDALAARRRRLPMVKFGEHVFDTPEGRKTLAGPFDGRLQLVTYRFMDLAPGKFCPACTASMNNGAASVWMAADNLWEALHCDTPLSGDAFRAQAAERLRRANA
jgi:predicted dithiol-disulfide oxidoreductase (DUF899 family)